MSFFYLTCLLRLELGNKNKNQALLWEKLQFRVLTFTE
jgi:hypothetical protein